MVDVSKIRERFDELSTPILKSGRLYQLATFTPVEEDIILHHMFPLVPIPPHTKEAWIVTTCDKACSTAETLTGNPYKKDGFRPTGFSTPESDFQGTTNSESDGFNDYMDYGNLS